MSIIYWYLSQSIFTLYTRDCDCIYNRSDKERIYFREKILLSIDLIHYKKN